MSSVCLTIDKIKGYAKSSSDFIDGWFHRRQNSARRSPIDILKRLQREVFSDVMKLRDRQNKVEQQMLSFCKTSKRSLLHDASTRVRGELDVLGPVLVLGDSDWVHGGAADSTGVRAGLDLRFLFETPVGKKNTLFAEFLAAQKEASCEGDSPCCALALAKVLYSANIKEWLSAVAIPFGAQFKDFGFPSFPCSRRKGSADLSSTRPSFLNKHNGMAVGLMARAPSVHAAVAQSLSEEGTGLSPPGGTGHCFSTFGQVTSQLPRGLLLSILGVHQFHRPTNHFNIGSLRIPLHPPKHADLYNMASPPAMVKPGDSFSTTGSVALKIESELDDSAMVCGWVELNSSGPRNVRWAVTASDDSDCETGWGFTVGGLLGGANTRGCFQAESYVKLNLEERFTLKPSIVYEANGDSRSVSLLLRSNCSF